MPRRAWQRRNLGRNRTAPANPPPSRSNEQPIQQQTQKAQGQGRRKHPPQEVDDEAYSSAGSGSDSESNGEYDNRRPIPRRTIPSVRPGKRQKPSRISLDASDSSSESESDSDSNSDSGVDSGYGSLSDDADDMAEHYDELLARFQAEGPTLANHGEKTQKMEQGQLQIWTK